MTAKRKEQIEGLVSDLKESGKLTATEFFKAARASAWGKTSETLVEDYNETLGRMFGRGALSYEEVNRAMNP